MNLPKFFNPIFLASCLLATLLVTGCASDRDAIKVERHSCFLMHFSYYEPDDSDMEIFIDIPVNAPKALTDSITSFLNEELYCLFENGDDRHLPYEKVFSTDLPNLANHYWDAYRSFYGADDPYITEFVHWFELNLVAQTDTYLTYEVVCGFIGEGPEESRSWTTFVKKDGRRLKEVVNDENMLRFYKDNPEFRNESVWEYVEWVMSEGYDPRLGSSVGLLNDSVAHQYMFAPGIYEDIKYPLEVIKPYLSEEAQQLVH
jgi:hypothetical protein